MRASLGQYSESNQSADADEGVDYTMVAANVPTSPTVSATPGKLSGAGVTTSVKDILAEIGKGAQNNG